MSSAVVTRFAPSPTGYLHAGGARTAIFNWAFARKHKGRFILRLEDTDRKRSTDKAADQIFKDLEWLGIDWDEGPQPSEESSSYLESQIGQNGPYCQSQRLEIYDKYVQQLIESERAYESDTDDERGSVIRFRTSGENVVVPDSVLGTVTFHADELEDFIIRKSDGYATYHLAVVVDDYLMGVTHVFRAQEHLSNTPKHIALQAALGFPQPVYAHFPLIFNPDGKKMSKREKPRAARNAGLIWSDQHGLTQLASRCRLQSSEVEPFLKGDIDDLNVAEKIAESLGVSLPEIDVHDFRKSGYLPNVLCNYLSLLGWSPGNDRERFDLEFLAKNFDLARAGKSSARFDRKKLLKMNGDAIRDLSDLDFADVTLQFCRQFSPDSLNWLDESVLVELATECKKRAHTLADIVAMTQYLRKDFDSTVTLPRPVDFPVEREQIETGLRTISNNMQNQKEIDGETAADYVRNFIEAMGNDVKTGSQVLRHVLTRESTRLPLEIVLRTLGPAEAAARIERFVARD